MQFADGGLFPEMVPGAFFCSTSTMAASFLTFCDRVPCPPALLGPGTARCHPSAPGQELAWGKLVSVPAVPCSSLPCWRYLQRQVRSPFILICTLLVSQIETRTNRWSQAQEIFLS